MSDLKADQESAATIVKPLPQVRHPLLQNMPRWYDVRGPDGKLLFKFCPSALLIEIVVRGRKYPLVDLMEYIRRDAGIEKSFYIQPDEPSKP